MTSKSLLIYYSATGNTKAIVNLLDENLFDIVNIRKDSIGNINKYKLILLGTSTWGRGLPPKPFLKVKDELLGLQGKKIGIFGSGRQEFENFCGALDVLEEMLRDKNTILFKYKYEGYPTERNFEEMKILIKQLEELI